MNKFSKSSIAPRVFLCFGLLLFNACVSRSRNAGLSLSAAPRPGKNEYCTFRTLCIVELQNQSNHPQISADVTESLYQAIQKKNRFDLSLLSQNQPEWKNLPLHPDSACALENLLAARKMLGVDGVLFGSVTGYTPYPHTAMGLKLKLIDLRDGRLCWTIERFWDTDDKATLERIKKYFQQQKRPGFSPLDENLAILSSINFVKFVTYDVAESL